MSSPTFTLRLLGGASLEGPAGPVSGRVVQRRRLALLALLAMARDRGVSRDKILGYLWPESPTRGARHLLSESIYVIRRELGVTGVHTAGDDLMLNPDVIRCDAVVFQAALARGTAEAASELYGGPFMDGFFLPGAIEFERWVERERRHLRERAVEAAWLVARRSEAAGALDRAVDWARRAVILSEGDEAAVRNLIGFLVRSGNRAAALQAYGELIRDLREQYDLQPSLETLRLVQWVRAWGQTPGSASESAAGRLMEIPSPLSDLPMAISPFPLHGRIVITEPAHDLAELLSVALHGAGGIRVELESASPSGYHDSHTTDDSIIRLRVQGTLVANEHSMGARVSVLNVAMGGVEILKLAVSRFDTNLAALADELAMGILGGICVGPAARLAASACTATSSLQALKHWLQGERAFRSGSTVDAVMCFQRALIEDPAFPLAHYRLAVIVACFPQRDQERARAAMAAALHHANRLTDRDRALLEAFSALIEGAADEAERTYSRLVDLYSDDVEAWFGLAYTRAFYNPLRGRLIDEALEPFERAQILDPSFALGTVPVAYITAHRGDLAALDFLCELPLISDIGLQVRTSRAFIRGDAAEQERWLAALRRASDAAVAESVRYAVVLAYDLPGAARMARLLAEPTRSPDARSVGHALAAHLELAAGHLLVAKQELDRLAEFDSATATECRALFAVLPHFDRDPTELRVILEDIRRADATAMPSHPGACLAIAVHDGFHEIIYEYLMGLVHARLNDESVALTHANRLDSLGDDVDTRSLADDFAWSVHAWTHWWAGRLDQALRSAERARFQAWNEPLLYSPFQSRVLDRYLRGTLLERAERYDEAEGWYASVEEYAAHDAVLLAPALAGLGRVRAARGDTEAARQAFDRVLRLLRDAEPEFATLVQEAREWRGQLAGDRPGWRF